MPLQPAAGCARGGAVAGGKPQGAYHGRRADRLPLRCAAHSSRCQPPDDTLTTFSPISMSYSGSSIQSIVMCFVGNRRVRVASPPQLLLTATFLLTSGTSNFHNEVIPRQSIYVQHCTLILKTLAKHSQMPSPNHQGTVRCVSIEGEGNGQPSACVK